MRQKYLPHNGRILDKDTVTTNMLLLCWRYFCPALYKTSHLLKALRSLFTLIRSGLMSALLKFRLFSPVFFRCLSILMTLRPFRHFNLRDRFFSHSDVFLSVYVAFGHLILDSFSMSSYQQLSPASNIIILLNEKMLLIL